MYQYQCDIYVRICKALRGIFSVYRHAIGKASSQDGVSSVSGIVEGLWILLRSGETAAVGRAPDNPVALNNLAHVLMLQGDLDAAETVALRAVDLGGSTEAVARQTLAAIRAKLP